MKQLTCMLLLVIAVAGASSIASAQPKPKMTDEQALIALDKQWTAAELRLNDEDRKTIDRIVADDYTDITPFGQIENKAQYMRRSSTARTRRWPTSTWFASSTVASSPS